MALDDWTRFLPSGQSVTAVPPTWERPRFNQVGAMQAAQKYLADQQAMDIAKQEAPVNLALSKARLAGAEHDLSRQNVNDQYEDLRLSQAQKNAADIDATRGLELEAKQNKLAEEIRTGKRTAAEIDRALKISDAIKSVSKWPAGSAEQQTAWNTFVDGAEKDGTFTPQDADYWRQHGYSPDVATEALGMEATIKNALTQTSSYGGASGFWEDAKAAEKASVYGEARQRAKDKAKKDGFGPATITQAEIDAEVPGIVKERGYKTRTSAALPAESIVKDQADYEGKIDRPVRETDKISKGASERGLTVAEKKAGQKVKAKAAGSTRDDPATYAGDPNDEKAQQDWFAKIPAGAWFVNPATGDILPKKK